MTDFKGMSIDNIIERGGIAESDVLKMRSVTYADGRISEAEAEALFRLNDAGLPAARAWDDYFIEAITDYLVNQAAPYGYVTANNAEWLMDRVSRDGRIQTRNELELVINVIDRARWSPESLIRFALEHVRTAVISGTGVLRSGHELKPGFISEAEVELLRRMLYAFGGDGSVAVTRAEAEILFEINDAVSEREPHPAWTEFFVKAITNAVMSMSSYKVPTREEALRREAWLDSHTDLTPLGVAKQLATGGFSLLRGYRALTREESALDRLERQRVEMIVNEKVTEGEAIWLAERILRDGRVNANEAALLAYLRSESPDIHPSLRDLIERYAPAA
ncbi:MAG: hypothetical protein KDJ47_07975 [Hyphomicrobiaceae bacterium]|nr:hypothetical protein [Hyphomicrobiaceae bacterium]